VWRSREDSVEAIAVYAIPALSTWQSDMDLAFYPVFLSILSTIFLYTHHPRLVRTLDWQVILRAAKRYGFIHQPGVLCRSANFSGIDLYIGHDVPYDRETAVLNQPGGARPVTDPAQPPHQ
jgi:hypothetical protein